MMNCVAYDLRVSLIKNNLCAERRNIVFSWKLPAVDGASRQQSYRLQISKDADSFEGSMVFDSLEVKSENHLCVRIDSPQTFLKGGMLYYWRVSVTLEGGETPFCSSAAFITAPDELSACFIGQPEQNGSDTFDRMLFMRSAFALDGKKTPQRVILRMTALSGEKSRQYVFKAFVNGSFVGLGPARQSKSSLFYNSFDITGLVKRDNLMAVQLYSAEKKPCVMFEIACFYGGGEVAVITPAARVTGGDRAVLFGEKNTGTPYYYYPSENIDFSLYRDSWTDMEYDDSHWSDACDMADAADGLCLVPYPCENVLCSDTESAVAKICALTYSAALEREIIGSARICVLSDCEQLLTLRFGEECQDGRLVFPMRTGNRYEMVWSLKKGENTAETFGMMTWRYAELSFEKSEPREVSVKGRMLHNGLDGDISSFNCDNSLLCDIYSVSKYTVLSTSQDLMVDSQSRERRAYEGDLLINALSSYAFDDRFSLARFTAFWLDRDGTWPAEYPLFQAISAYNDYMYTGDDALISQDYEILKGFVSAPELTDLGQDMLLADTGHKKPSAFGAVLVDWPVSEHDGYECDRAVYNTVYNALLAGACDCMSYIAGALGKTADRTLFERRGRAIKKALNTFVYDKETGAFCDGLDENRLPVRHFSQHAAAFCLEYGVCADENQRKATASFAAQDGKIHMSVYGAHFLLSGLYKAGLGAEAGALMCARGLRSWHHMIYELGATITAEAWDPSIKSNMSFSHPWGSAPSGAITRGLFGIIPLEPGFKRFSLKPSPGSFSRAEITLPTVSGSIRAAFAAKNGRLKRLEAEVPGGTEALVTASAFSSVPEPEKGDTGVAFNGSEIILSAGRHILRAE